MASLIPLQSLKPTDLRERLAEALRADSPVVAVADLVSSIDWSRDEGQPSPETVEMLSELERLTTEVDENDIVREDFIIAVQGLAFTVRLSLVDPEPPLAQASGTTTSREYSSEPTIRAVLTAVAGR